MDILKARSELMQGKTIYDMNLRVVDYGRVSTDKDDQLNSIKNQVNYFSDMISSVESWVHVGSFADEGISGTQVYKREEFLKMIELARHGKIDLILTKEVSRFARNTIDSISYTQLLLKYGVVVFFISDNINTIYPDSEFRLTLMASMAQDEVRKLSERVKFGVKRSIKDRKVGGSSLYGYHKQNGKLTIIKEEARAVEMLYTLYASNSFGLKKIGEELFKHGFKTRKGKMFSETTLKKMLKNPRYKGYYTANLTEVEDYKTHKKRTKPKEEWIIEKDTKGNVPPIVREELWDKANKIYEERYKEKNKNVLNKEKFIEEKQYTSKIICMEHNKAFIKCANGKRKNNPVWLCNEYLRHGLKGCKTPILKEEKLDEIFVNVISSLIEDKDSIIDSTIKDYISIINENNPLGNLETLNVSLYEQEKKHQRLLEMSLKEMITNEEFMIESKKIKEEIKDIKASIFNLENEDTEDHLNGLIANIREYLVLKLKVKENIGLFFDLFIKKVVISKIDGNRSHLNLNIFFNFKCENKEIIIS